MTTQICLTPKPLTCPETMSPQLHICTQAWRLHWRHIQVNVFGKGELNTNLGPEPTVRGTALSEVTSLIY